MCDMFDIFDMLWRVMLHFEMSWCTMIWICSTMTRYDMLLYALKWRILRCTIPKLWFQSYVMNEMIYESSCMHIIEFNMWGMNGVFLHDLCIMESMGDLMHNYMFMCIGILPLYDWCVHYKTEMTIMLALVHDRCCALWVSGYSLEELARPASPGSV